MTSRVEAIEVVEKAFAGAPRPSNAELLHPQCGDTSVGRRRGPGFHDLVVPPRALRGGLVEFARSKHELLTSSERHAVEVALEALAPHEQLDADLALASWRASG